MSEQKQTSFMQELDRWTEASIARPLLKAAQDYDDSHVYDWDSAVSAIKLAIRAKVLDSYRNGLAAGQAPAARKAAVIKNGLPTGRPR